MLKGRIIKNISNIYSVAVDTTIYNCQARGKFRNIGLTPLVGDIVEFDEQENYILNILPRENELNRPSISNIDYALIITSLKKPDLSLHLLDKEISSVLIANIKPIICFTKIDLITKKEEASLNTLISYYTSIGIPAFKNDNLEPLKVYLQNKYIVLTGQTGAGKSSLINKLDTTKNLATGEISLALGRGRHTTRHTEFHKVGDCFIADTPGFSSLDLSLYTKELIRDSFSEFAQYSCKYRDCMHTKEQDCAIKAAVQSGAILKSRYDNYCNFLKEVRK